MTRTQGIAAAFVSLCAVAASGPARAADASAPVTFSKDVAPILQRNCQVCHRPGTVAPMSLMTYDEARPWARSIRQRVAQREMPPWHIDKTQGIQHYKNDRSLSDAEIATIVRWVDAGAPEGDRKDLPRPVQFRDDDEWTIGKPDLIITSPAHVVAATAADWWGDYDVPTGLTEDRYVKAIETKPSKDGRFVNHHATVSVIQDADPFVAGGRPGAGENGQVISNFSEYVVGKYGDVFSEGSGRLLKAGSRLRFGLHYHSVGKAVTDRVSVAIVFYPKGYVPKYISRWITIFPEDFNDIEIPPGEITRADGYYRLPKSARIDAFQPHMHMRGKAQCLEAIYPNVVDNPDSLPVNARSGATRREILACVDRFDFNWQVAYFFADDTAPLLPAGTILHQIAIFDNTAANRHNPDATVWVGYGQRSVDEMCNTHVTAVFLSDDDFTHQMTERQARRR
jgi:mono/diheme cytochrome c family protein